MRYERQPSFDNTIKILPESRKIKVKEAIKHLVTFFETEKKAPGLGLKKLQKNYWEIRTNIKDRILFKFKGDIVKFIIVGTHDEIKRYLKDI